MITDWNLLTAARTLWQEARGEPLEGQIAVAHAIVNRRNSGRWGSTLAEVCLSRAQFSGWYSPRGSAPNVTHDPNFPAACRLADADPLLQSLAALIIAAESEADPTDGANNYYAASMNTPPAWATTMEPVGKIGNQFFFKPKVSV